MKLLSECDSGLTSFESSAQRVNPDQVLAIIVQYSRSALTTISKHEAALFVLHFHDK